MANEVRKAAERCDIMVGSVGSWPICAMSAFLDACERLKPEQDTRFGLPTIPSALRFRQEQCGWNQTEMARRLKLPNGHYSEILSGKRMLPYKAACRAHALGVPAKVLLALKNRCTDNGNG